MSDIRGLEQWEGETREYNRQAGKLKMRAGTGLVDALERWYSAWQEKHTDRNRREYMTWRLRLHLKHNSDPEFLQELNEYFNLGLHDEEIGPTFWHLEAEHPSGFRTGYNWRKHSGYALQGGRNNRFKPSDDLEEFDDE